MAAPNMIHKKLKMCFLNIASQKVLIWEGAALDAHTNRMDLYSKLCCNEEQRAQFTYREHRKSVAVQHSWHKHVYARLANTSLALLVLKPLETF